MKRTNKLALAVTAALGLLASTASHAESTYGYNTAGAGTVIATARINLSIVVPRVVVLRVGQAGAGLDTLTWGITVTIPGTPSVVVGNIATPTNADSQATAWTGAIPTLTAGTAPTTSAFVWSNSASTNVTCSASAFLPATGPTLANITATNTAGTFLHPLTTAGLTTCTTPGSLTAGTLYTATWTYTLDTTGAAAWASGSYSSVLTYTATGT